MKNAIGNWHVVLKATALLAVAGVTSNTYAQSDYPNRPIRLVTPAAPGGTTDILARLVGAKLTDALKQQVIVDNRASASGVVAAEIVANSPPDGYTLFVPYHQHTVNAALNPKLPYHAVDSFTPITQLTAAGLMLVVNPSTPVKTVKEFVEWTKSYKGALNFGSTGIQYVACYTECNNGHYENKYCAEGIGRIEYFNGACPAAHHEAAPVHRDKRCYLR